MKNITIDRSKRGQNGKVILLGNGHRVTFTSLRQAGAFVADTNRFLTKAMVSLNDVMIELFREYRLAWFVTTNSHHGRGYNNIRVQTKVKSSIGAAECQLDKFTYSTSGSNDSYMAFVDLTKTAIFLKDACEVLVAFHKEKNATSAYYNCQMLQDRCLSVIEKLRNYGA